MEKELIDRDVESNVFYHSASLSSLNSYEFIVGVLFGAAFGFFGVIIANIIHIMSIRIISMIAKISYNTLRTKRIRDVSISRGLVYGFAFGISLRYIVSFVSFLIVFYKLKN